MASQRAGLACVGILLGAYAILSMVFWSIVIRQPYVLVVADPPTFQRQLTRLIAQRVQIGYETDRIVLAVYVRVENHGYQAVTVVPYRFSLVVVDREYSPTPLTSYLRSHLQNVTLADGESAAGWVAFETPVSSIEVVMGDGDYSFNADSFFGYNVRYAAPD